MRMKIALAAALAVVLGGCGGGGIGGGSRLETLRIQKLTGLLGTTDNRAFVCFRDALQAVGSFSDGLQGDFSSRAIWSSSNPAVVEVSNNDIHVPGDDTNVFVAGTLIPRTVGTATITATYVGLTASYEVRVHEAESVHVTPATQSMSPASLVQFQAVGVFDGYTVDVTSAPQWSIDNPDTTVATIGAGTGLVQALKETTAPLTVRAKFLTCDTGLVTTDPANTATTASVNIATPVALVLEREFGGNSGQLFLNTSDALQVTAQFADGTAQNLSTQARFSATPTTVIGQFSGSLNIIKAVTAGSVAITACFDPQPSQNDADPDTDTLDSCAETDPNRIVSNAVNLTTVAGTVQSIAVTPANPAITGLRSQQFRAIGTFAGNQTQDVTRHVAWSVSDSSVALISNAANSAGLAFALKPVLSSTDVTATMTDATLTSTTLTATTKLCIYPPETTERPCPPNP
jgi:hypothetical protein